MKMSGWFIASIVALFCASIASAADATTVTLPVIDGKIDDPEWTDARVLSDFFTVVPQTGKRNEDSTIVLVRQTQDALYFAFKFHPRSKVITAVAHSRPEFR